MSRSQTLVWTPELVARFWDYWSRREDARSTYFASQVGAGVVRFLERAVRLEGARTLDYGAGPGYLTEQLLGRGAQVFAVDYSRETVAGLEEQFAGRSGWGGAKTFDGCRLPWADETFDVVCCLETLEHLLEEDCGLILQELHRVLKVGGTALYTTPNSENLRDQQVFCPCCRTEFHRWQHVRSWSPETLRRQLERQGYQVVFCQGLHFQSLQDPRAWKASRLAWWAVLAAVGRERRVRLPRGSFFPKQVFRCGRDHLAAVAVKQWAEGVAACEPRAA